jgi:hypothetical protein
MAMSSRKTLVWRTAPAAHGFGMALSALLLIVGGVLVLLPFLSLVLAVMR